MLYEEQELVQALVDTSEFAWSYDNDALDINPSDKGGGEEYLVVAGFPDDLGVTQALEQWCAALERALPDAEICEALLTRVEPWEGDPPVRLAIWFTVL